MENRVKPDWNNIIQAHGKAVFGVAWQILGHAADSEDVVQEVFLEAQQKTEQDVENWGGFLRQLATFRAIDRLRQRRSATSLEGVDPVVASDSPEDEAIGNELVSDLRSALKKLPPRQAAVFCLRFFEDQSYEEIAISLGLSTTAVATALNKARMRLREQLNVESGVRP